MDHEIIAARTAEMQGLTPLQRVTAVMAAPNVIGLNRFIERSRQIVRDRLARLSPPGAAPA